MMKQANALRKGQSNDSWLNKSPASGTNRVLCRNSLQSTLAEHFDLPPLEWTANVKSKL